MPQNAGRRLGWSDHIGVRLQEFQKGAVGDLPALVQAVS